MRNDRGSGPRRPSNRPQQREGNREARPNHPAPGHYHRRPVGDAPPLDRERALKEVERFTDLAIRDMGLALQREIASSEGAEGPEITVRFSGEDEELLLEHNAELLLALEYVAHRWLRLDPRLHDQVRFDCADYRSTRLDELKLSARVAAQRVRETGQDFHFNPMSSRDRRIIHLELNGAAGVRTVSEGMGDQRHLVIYPIQNNKR